MTVIHAASALTPEGWQADVRIGIEAGRIVSVDPGRPAGPGAQSHAIVLPGMPNLHSHAFQRGMAGLAETAGSSSDNFWSWRETMYRFALAMTPDQMEAIAGQLYVEMLEAGFSRVGEFHYLHHDVDGRPYADIAEMGARIASAAAETGIGLTLLPVFYAHSTFGGMAPHGEQRRFVSDLDGFAGLLAGCRAAVRDLDGAVVGVAPHSLRAVTPQELAAIAAMGQGAPVHIHVAEQTKEVEDCLAWSGSRPVEWLLDNAAVDERWCLIHATHMTSGETLAMARSGAIAGLCPITEANLGDGTFNAREFARLGGRYGIGSDSNVLIGVADELRQLEYSQRLLHRERNVMAGQGGSTGRSLFDAALAGGTAALTGARLPGLQAGAAADLVSLDGTHPSLAGRRGDSILDAWIFAGKDIVDCVWVGGRRVVEGGRHVRREGVERNFRKAIEALLAA